jgi:hypothetical protein
VDFELSVPNKAQYDQGDDNPREADGAVGCNPEVPLLALPSEKMICWRVSPRVDNLKNNDPEPHRTNRRDHIRITRKWRKREPTPCR